MTTFAQSDRGRAAPRSADRQVWNRRDILSRRTWRFSIPDAVADEFVRLCATHPEHVADYESCEPLPAELRELRRFAGSVLDNLCFGDGVAWIRGLDRVRDLDGALLGESERRLFYAALGSMLGTPMTQYGVLFPVRDRGVDYKTTALPVSMTNAETAFHTDSSSVDANPDFVGLLCENPSRTGGESLVVNALHVFRQLEAEAPAVLRQLEQDFIRDVVTPGRERSRDNLLRNRFPVFAPCDRREGLVFRYMRYWIERGQENAGHPLDAAQVAALDELDRRLMHPDNVVNFRLGRGDVIWINNRTLAHNRTAYRDTDDNVRQLQRMWIQLRA